MKLTMTQTGDTYHFALGEVGSATLDCGEDAVVTHLYVAPDFRNQGYGSRLVKAMKKLAKTLEYLEISGKFSDENQDLWEVFSQFYQANGFSQPVESEGVFLYEKSKFPWDIPRRTLPYGMEVVPFSQLQPRELDGLLTAFGADIAPFGNVLDMELSLSLWQKEAPLAYILLAETGDTLVIFGLGCGDTATGGSVYLLSRALENRETSKVQTLFPLPGATPCQRETWYQCWKGW